VAKKRTVSRKAAPQKKRPIPKKKVPPKKAAPPSTLRSAFKAGAPLLAEAIPSGCPARVYDGEVILDDPARTSFLRTAGGTYLMLLDPDCSGTFSAGRVDAAYGAFSQNPGRNQRLICNGFLHEDGTAQVLHVVS
jgi:hypothetical protein